MTAPIGGKGGGRRLGKPIRSSRSVVEKMDIKVGDILKLKKAHPCGSHNWEVLRTGADFRLKCAGCGHQIMTPRRKIEKNIVLIVQNDTAEGNN